DYGNAIAAEDAKAKAAATPTAAPPAATPAAAVAAGATTTTPTPAPPPPAPAAPEAVVLDAKVFASVALYARAHITPMAALVGGILAQDIVKQTGSSLHPAASALLV